MNNTLDHKCPSCGAVLKFNPHGQNWVCEYCNNNFNLEQIKEYEKKVGKVLEKDTEVKVEIDVYSCPNCGAEIIADENTSTTSCVYCKNTAILKNKLQGEFHPDYLIPFRNTREDSIEAFKKLSKGRILMPKEFNNQKNIEEMSGIYIPFWLYDYDASGEINVDCENISTWTSGDYRYTKTDKYLVTRGGSMSFTHIPVDGSKRFDNSIMNSIEPFDYKDLCDFNYSYLSGFLSEKYDVNSEEAKEDAIKRSKNSFIYEMKKDIFGYDNIGFVKSSIDVKETKNYYVLLPVWMLNIKYKNKIYTFAMNGQTGKMVGNIPINVTKAIILFVSVFLVLFLILLLINYLVVIL